MSRTILEKFTKVLTKEQVRERLTKRFESINPKMFESMATGIKFISYIFEDSPDEVIFKIKYKNENFVSSWFLFNSDDGLVYLLKFDKTTGEYEIISELVEPLRDTCLDIVKNIIFDTETDELSLSAKMFAGHIGEGSNERKEVSENPSDSREDKSIPEVNKALADQIGKAVSNFVNGAIFGNEPKEDKPNSEETVVFEDFCVPEEPRKCCVPVKRREGKLTPEELKELYKFMNELIVDTINARVEHNEAKEDTPPEVSQNDEPESEPTSGHSRFYYEKELLEGDISQIFKKKLNPILKDLMEFYDIRLMIYPKLKGCSNHNIAMFPDDFDNKLLNMIVDMHRYSDKDDEVEEQ